MMEFNSELNIFSFYGKNKLIKQLTSNCKLDATLRSKTATFVKHPLCYIFNNLVVNKMGGAKMCLQASYEAQIS